MRRSRFDSFQFLHSLRSPVSFVPFYVQIMHTHTYIEPRQAATIAFLFFFLGRCDVRRCWCVAHANMFREIQSVFQCCHRANRM